MQNECVWRHSFLLADKCLKNKKQEVAKMREKRPFLQYVGSRVHDMSVIKTKYKTNNTCTKHYLQDKHPCHLSSSPSPLYIASHAHLSPILCISKWEPIFIWHIFSIANHTQIYVQYKPIIRQSFGTPRKTRILSLYNVLSIHQQEVSVDSSWLNTARDRTMFCHDWNLATVLHEGRHDAMWLINYREFSFSKKVEKLVSTCT